MRSKHAFRMLVPLRQSYTRRRVTSALVAAIVAPSVSCSESGEAAITVDAATDAAATDDAPFAASDGFAGDRLVPDAGDDLASGSTGDVASADVVEAGRIPLCVRLIDPNRPVKVLNLSADVRTGYLTRVAQDCSLEALFPSLSSAFAEWSN